MGCGRNPNFGLGSFNRVHKNAPHRHFLPGVLKWGGDVADDYRGVLLYGSRYIYSSLGGWAVVVIMGKG